MGAAAWIGGGWCCCGRVTGGVPEEGEGGREGEGADKTKSAVEIHLHIPHR